MLRMIRRSSAPYRVLWNQFFASFFWVMSLFELYLALFYILPYQFSEQSHCVQWLMYGLTWFVCFQAYANWICVRYFNSKCEASDSNALSMSNMLTAPQPKDGKIYSFLWTHCNRCNIAVPPRSHHCSLCRRCVKKHDHHCFFTGVCIGYFNQRYFIALNIYVAVACFVGWPVILRYLMNTFPPLLHWYDFLLPCAVYHCVLGNIQPHQLMMSLLLHIMINSGMSSVGFTVYELMLIYKDKTLWEYKRRINIRSLNTFSQKMSSALGRRWLWNLIFPLSLFNKPVGDGMKWPGVLLYESA